MARRNNFRGGFVQSKKVANVLQSLVNETAFYAKPVTTVRSRQVPKRIQKKRIQKHLNPTPDNWFGKVDTGDDSLNNLANQIMYDITESMKGKGRRWARETAAMMREVSPIYTGNLYKAVRVLNPNNPDSFVSEYEDMAVPDGRGIKTYMAGVNLKLLLPPPNRKHIINGGKRTGKMKKMPNYDYTAAADALIKKHFNSSHLGYDFLNKWEEIAIKNAERIFS